MKKLGKILLIIFAIFGILGIAVFGLLTYFVFQVDNKYTGQEMFDAINEYRASVNVQQLELDSGLCDNLVSRYLDIKEKGEGHKGFSEWLTEEGIKDNPKYGAIGEMYVAATTPQNGIEWWKGSPGHRKTLEMPTMKYGCAYANEGLAVVIMAEPSPTN